jgi:hypothetical protein
MRLLGGLVIGVVHSLAVLWMFDDLGAETLGPQLLGACGVVLGWMLMAFWSSYPLLPTVRRRIAASLVPIIGGTLALTAGGGSGVTTVVLVLALVGVGLVTLWMDVSRYLLKARHRP